jgi:hypothetical protein
MFPRPGILARSAIEAFKTFAGELNLSNNLVANLEPIPGKEVRTYNC